MKEMRIYIKFWNADTDEEEWRPFSPEDAIELLDPDDCPDLFGYVLGKTDQKAFDKTLEDMLGVPFSYERFLKRYLNNTEKDIYIEL